MGRLVFQLKPRLFGWAAMLAAAMAVGGCMAPYGERVEPEPLAQDRLLAPEAAFVAPPVGGPSVIGVIQRTYRNAVRQSIILHTDGSVAGENTFDVTFYGPLKAAPDAGNLKRDTGTLTEIAGEMRRKIPLPMAVSPEYAQNSYGPFGFAFGGTAAGRCLFAWQRIHAQRNIFQEPSARGEISLRLRLCRRGATDAQLLAVMYGYQIVATLPNPNWNPFGTPPPADPAIGQRGVTINPLAHEPSSLDGVPAAAAPVVPTASGRGATTAPRSTRRRETAPTVPTAAGRVGQVPDRLPTPIADPSLVRQPNQTGTPPQLGMPPALSEASPAAAPASSPAAAVPPAPSAGQPVRQIVPGSPSSPVPAAPAAPASSNAVPAAPRATP
jgi:hypothetical protein